MNSPNNHVANNEQEKTGLAKFGDPVVLLLSGGFVILFVALSFLNIDAVASSIATGFAWTASVLGSYFQILLLMTFFIAIGLAVSPAASAKIGGLNTPELSTFKWCTGRSLCHISCNRNSQRDTTAESL